MASESKAAAAVETVGVHKSYHRGKRCVEVLRGLDLQVSRGEFVAIMGASGSGKSTLLHLLAGLTKADRGEVRVGGQDLRDMSDAALSRFRRRKVGLVFQSFNLVPCLSAEDNIRLPLLLDGCADPINAELLSVLGLTERRKHHPDALSGGEQQRVAIARALAGGPDVLLADEPTGNLDSIATRELGKMLQAVNRQQGRTVLLVTHDALVASWAHRVLFLRDGQMVDELQGPAAGEPGRIGAHYLEVMGAAARSAS